MKRKKRPMKAPTKDELYQQVNELTRQNTALIERLEAEKRATWQKNIPAAELMCLRQLSETFPYMVTNLRFEHVDEAGYWFTFELRNDARPQTYAVRHSDLA